MRNGLRIAVLVFLAAAGAAAAADGPAWPTLPQQLSRDGVRTGSALEALIKANQDFGMLRPEEAKDLIRVPLWLRVAWRKAHPEGNYSGDDPTGGYPHVLKEAHEWMVTHQDLVPGPGVAGVAKPEPHEALAASVGANLRISGAQTSPRSESDIRINFWDPTKVLSASNNISGAGVQAIFYSTNSGANWNQTTLSLQPGDAFHSDPTAEWTSDGKAWSSTLGINSGATVLQGRNYVSNDNGATWAFDGTFSGAQTSVDKQLVWVDHVANVIAGGANPYVNQTYVIWHNGNPAYMNRRTAGGVWGAPIQVSGAESTGTCIGADVTSNQDGEVFGFWPTTTNRRVFVVKSTNGGTSYGAPVQVAQLFDGYDIGIPSMNSRRALIYVSGGTYKTASKDNVYASWTDLTGAAGCTAAGNEPGSNVASTCKTRIWFSRSTNGGTTWDAPKMINNQASLNDQFNQRLVVDPANGVIAVMYYDTVADAGRLKTDVWYQSSFDDGATFNPAVKVTTAMTDETVAGADSGNQYGDYNGLSGYAATFFPSWTDRRNNASEEIWTAAVADAPCTAPGAPTIGTASATGSNQITVTWSAGVPAAATYRVYRAPGTCAAPGAFAPIASGLAGSPYVDNAVSGGSTYAYKVSGFEATGLCESTASACVEATATGACTLPPTFAGLSSATNAATASCQIALAWNAGTSNCGAGLTYNVYRSTSSGFAPAPANQIATGVSGTAYTDSSPLTYGTTYYYVVRAVDTGNALEETNAVQKSAIPTGPVAISTLTETFELGAGFDNPGWTHAPLTGAQDWAWSTAQSHSATHSWFAQSLTTANNKVLVSPSFGVNVSTTFSFWHNYHLEQSTTPTTCFDGGTLEISTDGGANWAQVPGTAISGDPYTGTVSSSFSNPLAGKPAWCNGSALTGWRQVTVDLTTWVGQTAQVRWREGDDSSVARTGWYVDDVTIANAGLASPCNATPVQLLGFDVE